MQAGALTPGLCPHCRAQQLAPTNSSLSCRKIVHNSARQTFVQGRWQGREASRVRLCTRAAVAAPEKPAIKLDVTKMAPLGDRLLVKPQEAAKTTAGGVLLSAGATQPIQEALIGQVLAVGEDVKIEVKVGDTVIFSKYSSTDVKAPDGDISFVAEKSILATLT